MQPLTDQGWQKVLDLAQRYGVTTDAVTTLLQALVNGNGTMAQFYHNDLGGGGQWMQGGMTMVSDLFNNALKAKVDNLCSELSQLLQQQPFVPTPPPAQSSSWAQSQNQNQGGSGSVGNNPHGRASLFVPGTGGNWWPSNLGSPNGSGGQNNIRYAYFNQAHRLAVEINGQVTVYDTLDHHVGGVSQQQGSSSSLTLTSQYGTVPIASLPVVSSDRDAPPQQQQPSPQYTPPSYQPDPAPAFSGGSGTGAGALETDIFSKIERLADLHKKGILSAEEYATKKSELLSRL